jgi:hypothetical protein
MKRIRPPGTGGPLAEDVIPDGTTAASGTTSRLCHRTSDRTRQKRRPNAGASVTSG